MHTLYGKRAALMCRKHNPWHPLSSNRKDLFDYYVKSFLVIVSRKHSPCLHICILFDSIQVIWLINFPLYCFVDIECMLTSYNKTLYFPNTLPIVFRIYLTTHPYFYFILLQSHIIIISLHQKWTIVWMIQDLIGSTKIFKKDMLVGFYRNLYIVQEVSYCASQCYASPTHHIVLLY